MTTRNVTVLEPYYGGSHAHFVDTFSTHTRHACTLVTLPARKWKWRMRGAALWFAYDDNGWTRRPVDVVLCNDMLSAADLRAVLPKALRDAAIVCYFHENQLTYPLSQDDERDYQYGMTNISSALSADAVWFNSRYHLDSFADAAGKLLAKMPDHVPRDLPDRIRRNAAVLPPAVAVNTDLTSAKRSRSTGGGVRFLWCHRWEFDKAPEVFFKGMCCLADSGLDFEVVLVGEQFRTRPAAFDDGLRRLGKRVVHAGYVPDRRAYLELIASCDVVVSTAVQENFGIAVVEAILAGCRPLLPNRLAYPEVIPEAFHEDCLFGSDADLRERLLAIATHTDRMTAAHMIDLRTAVASRFAPATAIAAMDDAIEVLADTR